MATASRWDKAFNDDNDDDYYKMLYCKNLVWVTILEECIIGLDYASIKYQTQRILLNIWSMFVIVSSSLFELIISLDGIISDGVIYSPSLIQQFKLIGCTSGLCLHKLGVLPCRSYLAMIDKPNFIICLIQKSLFYLMRLMPSKHTMRPILVWEYICSRSKML